MITGTGHGKLLLCGEHAVVYGHPAIALAIDRCTRITLAPSPGETEVIAEHTDPRLLEVVTEALAPLRDGATGHRVTIETELPVGRGMGSSAALAVALVRARAAWRGVPLDPDATYQEAMPIERVFHGNPSGVDVAVSARGGCLWFQRSPDAADPALTPLQPGDWRLVVLDSGRAGDTAALVSHVAAQGPGNTQVLEQIGALVAEARAQLADPDQLGPLLTHNHRLLQQLGVSTPQLDALVELALRAGALGAKLSGAGGGGVVLALVDDPRPVLDAARAEGIPAFGCVPWRP